MVEGSEYFVSVSVSCNLSKVRIQDFAKGTQLLRPKIADVA